MQISFISEANKCFDCGKQFEQVYHLMGKNLCRNCLTNLAKLIFVTVGHFDRLGNPAEDKVLQQLEMVLEKTKNMTDQEYLELVERCKGMKDIAYEQMVALEEDI